MTSEKRPLLTKEAADYLHLSVSKLEKMRVDGTGPVFLKCGKAVRYEMAALDEWIAARRRKSTRGKAPNSASAAGLQAA
jgi:hypothetical protein